jgi:hypothetical protein
MNDKVVGLTVLGKTQMIGLRCVALKVTGYGF